MNIDPRPQPAKCSTQLIPDDPESEDYFQGAHTRVADTILELIRDEPGGRSIGLEGGYGTGKTTVVNILHSKLKDNSNYTLMAFDAWAHEGDPLRRTFLETVIKHLQGLNWVNPKEWEKSLDELAQRREVKSTKTIPYLTPLGKAIGFSLFLVPFGLAFINAALRDNLTVFEFSLPFSRKFLIGTFFVTLPLLILLVTWGVQAIAACWAPRQDSTEKDDAAGLWAVLFNKVVTEERTETTKTPNPTSIEFEDTFKKVMGEALSEQDKRIVLVLDNLDRINPEAALSIWSTLQTFIGHSHYGHPDWFKRLWILVLYDPKGLRLLWDKKESAAAPVRHSEVLPELPVENTSQQEATASSFIDKSFQIRFRVPPPVLSDWHEYLLKLLKTALPDHDESEFHGVYRVLETYLAQSERAPTIRKLKIYVNQIGAVHRQWGDTFPLSHVAYYALSQGDAEDNVQWFLKHPKGNYDGVLDEGVRDNLAALTFNVEKVRAMQLLLGQPIKIALREGDVNYLKQLSEFEKGFWEVLERVVTTDRDWVEEVSGRIANAAYCLSESGLLEGAGMPEAKGVVKALSHRASEVEMWPSYDEKQAKGIVALCTWAEDRSTAVGILKAVIYGLGYLNGRENPVAVPSFVEELRLIRDGLKKNNLYDLFTEGVLERIVIKLSTPSRDGLITKESRPIGKELKTLLIALFELSLVDENAYESLRQLTKDDHTAQHLKWAAHNLNVGNDYGYSTPEIIAWSLFILVRDTPDDFIPALLRNTMLDRPMPVPGPQPTQESLLELLTTDISNPQAGLYNQRRAAIPDIFSNIIGRYGDLNFLFKLLDAEPQVEPFVLRCLTILLNDSEYAKRVFTPQIIVERWPFLYTRLTVGDVSGASKLEAVTESVDWRADLLDQVYETGFDLGRAALYRIIARVLADDDLHFKKWCKHELQSVSRAQWEELLQLPQRGEELRSLVEAVIGQEHPDLDYDVFQWRIGESLSANTAQD